MLLIFIRISDSAKKCFKDFILCAEVYTYNMAIATFKPLETYFNSSRHQNSSRTSLNVLFCAIITITSADRVKNTINK
jgi:hypothetical protein